MPTRTTLASDPVLANASTTEPASGVDASPGAPDNDSSPIVVTPDLTPVEVATPTVSMVDCSSTIFLSLNGFNSIEEMAWLSERILVGTVEEKLVPVWGPERHPFEPGRHYIVTPYIVEVDRNVRGSSVNAVTVGQFGGAIEGCEQTFASQIPLEVGDRVLLFLIRDPFVPSFGSEPAWFILSMHLGQWLLDGDVVARTPGGPFARYAGLNVDTSVQAILKALNREPPASPYFDEFVPLDSSPPASLEPMDP